MNLTVAALCVVLAAPGAPVPKERADAEKVVGVWKLVKSSNNMDGREIELQVEFTKGGKMIIRQTVNGGPQLMYEGEYKIIKNELPYTMKLPNGQGEKKETLTIKKITEAELIMVDPDGIQEDFERVKPKKDDK